MTDHPIAAFLAAHTPLKAELYQPTYQLLPIPGTELCEACPCCDGAHTLPNCKQWAGAAGEPLIARLRKENAALREHLGALLTNPYHEETLTAARAWLRRAS